MGWKDKEEVGGKVSVGGRGRGWGNGGGGGGMKQNKYFMPSLT